MTKILCSIASLACAQSPFLTGATSLQTEILTWLTPIAIILVMVLGAMASRILGDSPAVGPIPA